MRSLSLFALALFVIASPYSASANVGDEISSGGPISASFEKAVTSGLNIADVVSQALVANPELAEKIIFVGVNEYSDFAGEIVAVAINSGVALRTVMVAAIKGAPHMSGQILSAALNIMPENEDVIIQYAIQAGVPHDIIARAVAATRIANAKAIRSNGTGEPDINMAIMPNNGRGGYIVVVSPH